MSNLKNLFKNNKLWADKIKSENPDFFKNLSQQQNPEYLWIGCSDSRVSASQITNLAPGNLFVHRNIANIVTHTDLNCMSVIEYAVLVLKVKHIIVCGHYGCGGIKAAMDKSKQECKSQQISSVDNWLNHIESVTKIHKQELNKLSEQEHYQKLCELNVIEQTKSICNTDAVKKAWNEGANLNIHGWIYDISNGILKDLKTDYNTSKKCID